ncbi:hypothetical protein R3P38DRAFT_2834266 [Favolaschia claudopus]|uniref:Transmembrane protein n=1 Tax=Favolaschia claudopus TaxID=2862362 RepID=A0AAW0ED27_9AGAR
MPTTRKSSAISHNRKKHVHSLCGELMKGHPRDGRALVCRLPTEAKAAINASVSSGLFGLPGLGRSIVSPSQATLDSSPGWTDVAMFTVQALYDTVTAFCSLLRFTVTALCSLSRFTVTAFCSLSRFTIITLSVVFVIIASLSFLTAPSCQLLATSVKEGVDSTGTFSSFQDRFETVTAFVKSISQTVSGCLQILALWEKVRSWANS